MTNAGRFNCSMILAMVKVLPEPVTPSSTWCFSPSTRPRVRDWIAFPWSPCGWYELTNLNSMRVPDSPANCFCGCTEANFVEWVSHHYTMGEEGGLV